METELKISSFWRRAAAALIDIIILGILVVLVEIVITKAWKSAFGDSYDSENNMYYLVLLAPFIIAWGYSIGFETDEGATLGKQALGIKVSLPDGSQPSFLRLTARWLLHGLSIAILGIGFLMALWTKKKQALHDILTGTLVVHKQTT